MKIAALIGSSRRNGNTEALIQRVLKGIDADTIYLPDFDIEPIHDQRHTNHGFHPVDDDYEEVLVRVLQSDVLIFGTPLYWYGMSGQMKNFFDRWSQYMRDEQFDLKNELSKKLGYVVVIGGDQPKIKALPLIQQFHFIFDFVNMDFADYMIGEAGKPGEITSDKVAMEKASLWNESFRSLITQ